MSTKHKSESFGNREHPIAERFGFMFIWCGKQDLNSMYPWRNTIQLSNRTIYCVIQSL